MTTQSGLVFIGGGDGYLYAFESGPARNCGAASVPYQQHRQPHDLPHEVGTSSSS